MRVMKKLMTVWDFVRRVAKRFIADACSGRAAGLAFSTLFALVPLSAFVVAVLTAFGAFDPFIEEAQQALIEQLVPAVHDEVFTSIRQFASNTRALGFLGFFIFLGTAVLLLRNINTSLNAIWGFRTRRGIWARVASYTTIIVIGTTLLSASFAVGPVVQSVIEAALPDVPRTMWFRGTVLPPVFLFLTLLSVYILVPAGRIRASSAAVGAGVAVLIWEVAKRIFVFWSTSVMRFSLIYGSLAALPIFLIWLYLAWFFILAGVETAYMFQHRLDHPRGDERESVNGPVGTVVDRCIDTAVSICRRHRAGENLISPAVLEHRLGAEMAERVRVTLASSGLFLDTDHGLVPARDVGSIRVADLVEALAGDNGGHVLSVWKRDSEALLTDIDLDTETGQSFLPM
jgi:membrane protein